MPRPLLPLLAVLITIAALTAFQLASTPALAARGAPAFSLMDSHGKPVTLDAFEGKPLVLNFWATWCPPCQLEIPELSAYAQAHPEVAVVGVAMDSGPAEGMPRLRSDLGIAYEIYAADRAIVNAYGVRGLPTTVVIDADGQVSATWTGPIDQAQLERLVKKAR
jgi:cytochrome c biogenesis protein CcmG, thiol:disulfide interchange protein DsbE